MSRHHIVTRLGCRIGVAIGLCLALTGLPAAAGEKAAGSINELSERVSENLDALKRDIAARLAQAKASGDKRAELLALRDRYVMFVSDPEAPAQPADLDRAIAEARALGDMALEASFETSYACLMEVRGQREDALKHHERSIALAERSGNDDVLIQALFEYGTLWYWAFRGDLALPLLERGLALSTQRQEVARQAWFLYYVAGTLRLSETASDKELAKVETYQRRALALLDPERHRRLMQIIMEALGLTYMRMEKLDDAKEVLQRVLAMSRERSVGQPPEVSHLVLGLIALKQGHPEQSKGYFQQVLANAKDERNTTLFARARLHLGLALAQTGQMVAAKERLAQARPVLLADKGTKLEIEYHVVASQVAVLAGDYKLAYESNLAQAAVERSLMKGDAAKRMEELSVRFDTRLKEADNQLLRAEQAQLQTKRTALALALALALLVVAGVLYFFWMQWKQRRRFERLAMRDELTGAPNRRSVMEHMKREFARPASERKDLVVGVMDIDFFKKVNDTYGHDAGDAVLKSFYKTCRDKLRPDDVLGRWGGEEFVLVTRSANVQIVFERLLEAVKAMDLPELKGERTITFSMGVCDVEGDTTPAIDAVLAQADEGLYAAKAAGRARCCVAPASRTSIAAAAAPAPLDASLVASP